MDYLSWNNALASHFFNTAAANRPVYLYVTRELLDRLGSAVGVGAPEFIGAVRQGPKWITDGRLSLCGKAYRLFEDWKSSPHTRDIPYPPYVAYLCLFSLAAGVEADVAPHAYYPRLHRLLGEDETSGTPAAFDRMWELWLGLDEWSKSELNGEFGVFSFRILGGWDHVGLPVGQTLLSEEERHSLPTLFSMCALDPDSAPSNAEMLALLREFGAPYLQRRTRSLLTNTIDTSVVSALVHAAISELEHWDGTSQEGDDSDGVRGVSSSLRLCCRYDPAAASVQFRMRCKAASEYPEAGLVLSNPAFESSLFCEEESLGWSTELLIVDTRVPLDASSLDWNGQIEFSDAEQSWHAVSAPSSIRLFVVGAELGLPFHVETTKLPRGMEFLVAACQQKELITSWGASACDYFEELDIRTGLPDGWSLFRGRNPRSDSTVGNVIPKLALPSEVKLSIRGGIRTQDGNTSRYFAFAPPHVIIESPQTNLSVSCNGHTLQPDATTPEKYSLPKDLPLDSPVRFEVRSSSSCEARASLTLSEPAFSRWQKPAVRFDGYGQRLPDGVSGLRGTMVDQSTAPGFNFGAAIPPIASSRVFLIGRVPGQVHKWPSSESPDWHAVWAIASGRRNGFVVPCMEDPDDAAPVSGQYGARKNAKKWKELVWHMRKRLAPPQDPFFRELWERYKEVARHV